MITDEPNEPSTDHLGDASDAVDDDTIVDDDNGVDDATSTITDRDECDEKCTIHTNKVLKYYCDDHRTFCCSACINLNHGTCTKRYIPSEAESVIGSDKYNRFKDELDALSEDIANHKTSLESSILKIQKNAETTLKIVKEIRRRINKHLDDVEDELRNTIQMIHDQEKANTESGLGDIGRMSETVEAMKRELRNFEETFQKCKVFVSLKKWEDTPDRNRKVLGDIIHSNRVQNFTFVPADIPKTLGHIEIEPEFISVQLKKESKCDIKDIAVLPNGIVALADHRNGLVKILHTDHFQVLPDMSIKVKEPIGVTQFKDNQFAITSSFHISEQKVAILNTASKLPTIQDVYVPLDNIGHSGEFISSSTDSLIFASGFRGETGCKLFDPTSHLSTKAPSIFKEFFSSGSGPSPREYRRDPNNTDYFAKSLIDDTMYVSLDDWLVHQTMDGDLLEFYSNVSLPTPMGVAVSNNGTVFVCDKETKTLHVLTADLKVRLTVKVDIGEAEPRALAYCNRFKFLYLCASGGHIFRFRMGEL